MTAKFMGKIVGQQIKGRHCENCGEPNPTVREGYTTCCNELVCYGDQWETNELLLKDGRKWTVEACCNCSLEEAAEKLLNSVEMTWNNVANFSRDRGL